MHTVKTSELLVRIDYTLAAENNIHAVLFDTKSAFDTVRHDALLIKLYEMGVTCKLWRVIAKSYQNIESAFMVNVTYHSGSLSIKALGKVGQVPDLCIWYS